MMYQDIYSCICQNTKKWRYTIQYVKPTLKHYKYSQKQAYFHQPKKIDILSIFILTQK